MSSANDESQKKFPWRAVWRDLVPAIALGLALWAFIVSQNQQKRVSAQVDDVQLVVINSCIKNNINAAIVRISASLGTTPEEEAAFTKTAENLYPIVDCKQGLLTNKSAQLSKRETDKYVELVREGRAPIINKGKVIGSRPSVLEGVTSINEVGTIPP